MTDINNFEFKFITSITEINAKDWNAVCPSGYPFIQHEFLHALEASQSVGCDSGWQPRHLVVLHNNRLVAAVPLYLKNNSYGEYVFDFQWAEAYHHSGIHYYPKLVTAIPFTPASGPRICIDKPYEDELQPLILEEIKSYAVLQSCSSWHLLFPEVCLDKSLELQTENAHIMKRSGVQYHWFNKGYASFEDFLSHCKMKKRKNIKRERKAINDAGVVLDFVEGTEASGQLWMQFFKFYQRTYLKRSGNSGYLNWGFFEFIANAMAEQIVFVVASFNTKVIGMSLFFKGQDTLYGRYWGASAEYEYLHFEACYYQGIDYCIKNHLSHFDAGAQGEHKIERGFEPVETSSFHWVKHPEFSQAIDKFLAEEKQYVDSAISELSLRLPFKR